jgi:hypothetical protein
MNLERYIFNLCKVHLEFEKAAGWPPPLSSWFFGSSVLFPKNVIIPYFDLVYEYSFTWLTSIHS